MRQAFTPAEPTEFTCHLCTYNNKLVVPSGLARYKCEVCGCERPAGDLARFLAGPYRQHDIDYELRRLEQRRHTSEAYRQLNDLRSTLNGSNLLGPQPTHVHTPAPAVATPQSREDTELRTAIRVSLCEEKIRKRKAFEAGDKFRVKEKLVAIYGKEKGWEGKYLPKGLTGSIVRVDESYLHVTLDLEVGSDHAIQAVLPALRRKLNEEARGYEFPTWSIRISNDCVDKLEIINDAISRGYTVHDAGYGKIVDEAQYIDLTEGYTYDFHGKAWKTPDMRQALSPCDTACGRSPRLQIDDIIRDQNDRVQAVSTHTTNMYGANYLTVSEFKDLRGRTTLRDQQNNTLLSIKLGRLGLPSRAASGWARLEQGSFEPSVEQRTEYSFTDIVFG